MKLSKEEAKKQLLTELQRVQKDGTWQTTSTLCAEHRNKETCTLCPVATYVGVHNYCAIKGLTTKEYVALLAETSYSLMKVVKLEEVVGDA